MILSLTRGALFGMNDWSFRKFSVFQITPIWGSISFRMLPYKVAAYVNSRLQVSSQEFKTYYGAFKDIKGISNEWLLFMHVFFAYLFFSHCTRRIHWAGMGVCLLGHWAKLTNAVSTDLSPLITLLPLPSLQLQSHTHIPKPEIHSKNVCAWMCIVWFPDN